LLVHLVLHRGVEELEGDDGQERHDADQDDVLDETRAARVAGERFQLTNRVSRFRSNGVRERDQTAEALTWAYSALIIDYSKYEVWMANFPGALVFWERCLGPAGAD